MFLPEVAVICVHSRHNLLITALEIELAVKAIYPVCPAAHAGRIALELMARIFEFAVSLETVIQAVN